MSPSWQELWSRPDETGADARLFAFSFAVVILYEMVMRGGILIEDHCSNQHKALPHEGLL